MKNKSILDTIILTELKNRLNILYNKPYSDLCTLPEGYTSETKILNKRIKFTVFREYQQDKALVIIVRTDKLVLFGFATIANNEGFIIYPNNERKYLTYEEIENIDQINMIKYTN